MATENNNNASFVPNRKQRRAHSAVERRKQRHLLVRNYARAARMATAYGAQLRAAKSELERDINKQVYDNALFRLQESAAQLSAHHSRGNAARALRYMRKYERAHSYR